MNNWKIEFYETRGNLLACDIESPHGRKAFASFMGSDNRLTKYRTEANIQFGSDSLRLTESLVDRMISAGLNFIKKQQQAEPEFALTNL